MLTLREEKGKQLKYNSSSSKASSIRNPAHRYLEKILSNTIFAKAEATIGARELYVIKCFLEGKVFNAAGYWIPNIFRNAKRKHPQVIAEGGLITLLARGMGKDLSGLIPLDGPNLGLEEMKKMRILEEIGNDWVFVLRQKEIFPVPNVELTKIYPTRQKKNITLLSKSHTTKVNEFKASHQIELMHREVPRDEMTREPEFEEGDEGAGPSTGAGGGGITREEWGELRGTVAEIQGDQQWLVREARYSRERGDRMEHTVNNIGRSQENVERMMTYFYNLHNPSDPQVFQTWAPFQPPQKPQFPPHYPPYPSEDPSNSPSP